MRACRAHPAPGYTVGKILLMRLDVAAGPAVYKARWLAAGGSKSQVATWPTA